MPIPTQKFSTPEVQKSGGFLGGLGGILKSLAPLAALIPGVGTLAALGISAATAGAGTAMQGGNATEVALGGMQGAAGAGVKEIDMALGLKGATEIAKPTFTREPTPSEAGRSGYGGTGEAEMANRGNGSAIDQALEIDYSRGKYTAELGGGAPSMYQSQYRGMF